MLIKNIRLLTGGNELTEASLIIEEGKIVGIKKAITPSNYDEVLDGGGLLALPGGIDIHAHIYDPQYLHHEDFRSGSEAALYGGVTTLFDMPLRMYVEDEKTFKIKYDAGLKDSLVNFGIIAGMMNEDNASSVKLLQSLGINLFKVFTCKPFRPKSDGGFTKVMSSVVNSGGVLIIHAEDDIIAEYLTVEFKNSGSNEPISYHESRPAPAEAMAIRRVVEVAKFLGLKKGVHIAHLSSADGLREVVKARLDGVNLTVETTPHHLYFTKEDVLRLGNYLKLAPTLKSRDDVRALWRALSSGSVDVVASDNAPSTRSEKEVSTWDAWGGIPSLEVMLPLVFTLGIKKLSIMTLERYVEVTSKNPARIAGIYPRKGALNIGSDADIVLIDPNYCFKVTADKLHHKVDWTPFEGLELCSWPRHVIINGQLVMKDREVILQNFRGSYVFLTPQA
ncbi:MAG: dihydroorotase family protein [Desulfurococcaceae archaeon TW002]